MTTQTSRKLHLGEPQISGPLAVYPIFGGEPRLRYRGLAQAVKHAAFITEVDEHGSVNDVLVCNASDQPVLLYEGELIVGAKQDRTIDQPVLVPAGIELTVPVSCVEQGRWDHVPPAVRFTPARHAADPELRRRRRATAKAMSAAGRAARPSQAETWSNVAERLSTHAVESPSAAFTDIFERRCSALDELKEPITALEGQLGALVEIAGQPVALDLVSRPEVFADLLPSLADGYSLQALEAVSAATSRSAQSDAAAEKFLHAVMSSRRRWMPTPGMGDSFAPTRPSIEGCGLLADSELVALSAFPGGRR